ncbi:hypothetical protein BH09BAC3_BH09BAC3_16420 [soil metagenome]
MKAFFKFVVVLVLFNTGYVNGGDLKYAVSDIQDSLKKGMYAVVRDEYSRFEIISTSKSIYYRYKVVTIFNEKAKTLAAVAIQYDKSIKIIKFQGAVYDASGAVIRRLKKSDIKDQSSISDFSIFEDTRIQYADLSQVTYPYTVEYEYEISLDYLYNIFPFYLYTDDEVAIQKSTYRLVYPKQLTPRFKTTKVPSPVKESLGQTETVTWTFENIRPSKFEFYSPVFSKIVPNIIAAPVEFEVDGYPGRLDSWQNLGKWQLDLNKGRASLPESSVAKIKEMTKGAKTIEEKTRILYAYLQNKTRYVSIQRGIGGFQPMEAKRVDELGYGDCKALSNYMVAMLNEVGVKGYYTIIYGGENSRPVTPDFPIDYFNHIIVAVPNVKDTLWLECTSQVNPFGYLGDFTGDRYALMVTEQGGQLVRTASYSTEQNLQTRRADVTIDIKGDGLAKVRTRYAGLQYDDAEITDLSPESQRKWIQSSTQIPSFEINNFSASAKKDKIPVSTVNVNYTLKRYASVSGKRLFLTPNLMNRFTSIPEKTTTRRTSIVQNRGYIDLDSIYYLIPEELYPEFLPNPVKISSRFGEYEANFQFEQGKLIYIRKIRMNKGEFPADSYNEFVDFKKNINKSDNTKVVFLNKT